MRAATPATDISTYLILPGVGCGSISWGKKATAARDARKVFQMLAMLIRVRMSNSESRESSWSVEA